MILFQSAKSKTKAFLKTQTVVVDTRRISTSSFFKHLSPKSSFKTLFKLLKDSSLHHLQLQNTSKPQRTYDFANIINILSIKSKHETL